MKLAARGRKHTKQSHLLCNSEEYFRKYIAYFLLKNFKIKDFDEIGMYLIKHVGPEHTESMWQKMGTESIPKREIKKKCAA